MVRTVTWNTRICHHTLSATCTDWLHNPRHQSEKQASPDTDGETEAQSNSGTIWGIQQNLLRVGMLRLSCSCFCLLDAVHTKHPTNVDASCLQKTLRSKIFSLGIPEPQEMISFPKSFGLHFQPISSCFIRRAKRTAKLTIANKRNYWTLGLRTKKSRKKTSPFQRGLSTEEKTSIKHTFNMGLLI